MSCSRITKALITKDSAGQLILTGGLMATYVILLNLQDQEGCGKDSDYLNPSFLAKLWSLIDLSRTAVAVYNHMDEVKGRGIDALKKAAFATGMGAVATFGGLWGATGKKAALACKMMNPLLNFATERLTNAYSKSSDGDGAGVHVREQEVGLEGGGRRLLDDDAPGAAAPGRR